MCGSLAADRTATGASGQVGGAWAKVAGGARHESAPAGDDASAWAALAAQTEASDATTSAVIKRSERRRAKNRIAKVFSKPRTIVVGKIPLYGLQPDRPRLSQRVVHAFVN